MIKSYAYTAKSEFERSLALCADRAILINADGQQTVGQHFTRLRQA